MLKKLKKIIILCCMTALFSSLFITTSTTISASSKSDYSVSDLTDLSASELLTVLVDNGLVLSDEYAIYNELAESFVATYVPLIVDGTVDPNVSLFNAEQSNSLLKNVGIVLNDMGVVYSKNVSFSNFSIAPLASYTLKDNTIIGSWSNSYYNYNCYAYAIGRSSGLQPGQLSGTSFSLTMSISEMANVVLEDLSSLGYWGYTSTSKPSSLPDEYFKVIAMRKDTSNVDYHFMKPYGSLNTWAHKPGGTQPLKWKYSSPGYKIWNNEAVINGVTYAPTVTYESTIVYIIYKSWNDPGMQPWSLDPISLDIIDFNIDVLFANE